jgi:localization factor PodJL
MRQTSQDDILADVRARLSLMEGHAAIAEPGPPEPSSDPFEAPAGAGGVKRRSSASIQTAPTQQAPTAMRSHDAQLDDLYASVAAVYTHAGSRAGAAPRGPTAWPADPRAYAEPLHEARHRPPMAKHEVRREDPTGDVLESAHQAGTQPIRVDRMPEAAPPVTMPAPATLEAVNDHAFETITQRLMALEEKLEAALMRSAEASPSNAILDRMDELKSQYQRVADEIARLEVIEDNLARLIDEVAERNTGNTLLAESVADRVMSQINAHTAQAQPAFHGDDRLTGIEQLLSSYVSDRQAEDGNTQQLLESIRVLVETIDGRVGVIEHEIQQATAAEPPMAEAAAPVQAHSPAVTAVDEDMSYDIGPEAYAAFEDEEAQSEPEARAEQMPKAARRSVLASDAEAGMAEPQPPLSPREQLIASARRAAKAAGAPAAARAKAAESPTRRTKAAKAEAAAPKVSNRAARFALDRKSPRPVIILAILALVLAAGGLLYGKFTRKPAGPTIKIERSTAPAANKPESAPAKVEKQSMIEEPLAEPADAIETGTAVADDLDSFGSETLAATDVNLDAPAQRAASDVVGSIDEDMPPEGVAPLAVRIKAANGDPVAQHQVASQFARGALGEPDLPKAAEWYAKAAKAGYAPAQYQLASMLQRGSGIEQSPAEARSWYAKSTAAGNVKAMHNLAVMLTSEEGGPRDYATAAKLFRKAADHGLADSQFNLAILYENGLGVKRSTAEAYRWFSLAATAGDKEGAARREIMKKRLAPSIVGRIDTEVKAWVPAKMDPASNAVPGLQAGASADTAVPAAAAEGAKPADVALVQDLLKSLGYEVGAPGLLDARTSEAISSFEQRSKLPPTGRISEDLIQRLMSLAG